eukprot:TRINITY_DN18862_c0_g1_i4.p1 TRINITY_DN18862_c0_g1~~TRINITY_DN18862_c0_g1_i4.p1  ORF type:complete len:203 (+),score=64.10 TRINITY_DN18862_c0_g1_i4:1201-1809(+)
MIGAWLQEEQQALDRAEATSSAAAPAALAVCAVASRCVRGRIAVSAAATVLLAGCLATQGAVAEILLARAMAAAAARRTAVASTAAASALAAAAATDQLRLAEVEASGTHASPVSAGLGSPGSPELDAADAGRETQPNSPPTSHLAADDSTQKQSKGGPSPAASPEGSPQQRGLEGMRGLQEEEQEDELKKRKPCCGGCSVA